MIYCDYMSQNKNKPLALNFSDEVKGQQTLKLLSCFFLFVSQPSADGATASESNAGQRLVIWGTDVNVGTCKEKFQVRNLKF